MLFCWLKKAIKLIVSTALVGVIVVVVWAYTFSSSLFLPIEGEQASRTYFVNSPTQYACEKQTLAPWDLPFVEGEKVVYTFDDRQAAAQAVECVLGQLEAQDIWTEKTGDTLSYYVTSKKFPRQVCVDGRVVNLHIAVCDNRVVVGTPIIFGGY